MVFCSTCFCRPHCIAFILRLCICLTMKTQTPMCPQKSIILFGDDDKRTNEWTREDTATQPRDAGWMSFAITKQHEVDILKRWGPEGVIVQDHKDISVNPPLRSTEEKFQTWFPHLLQKTAFYGFTGGINHWNKNLSFRVLHRRLYKRFYQHIENMTFTDN